MTIDRMLVRLNLARRKDYGLFLTIHYETLRDFEPDWRVEDRNDFQAMMGCLQSDRRTLSIPTKTIHLTRRGPLTVWNRLGVAYVIRGSRLGSGFLRRRVPPQFATAYLDLVPTLSWARFLDQLEAMSEIPECDTGEVIRGAHFAFDVFTNLTTQALA